MGSHLHRDEFEVRSTLVVVALPQVEWRCDPAGPFGSMTYGKMAFLVNAAPMRTSQFSEPSELSGTPTRTPDRSLALPGTPVTHADGGTRSLL